MEAFGTPKNRGS